ncbi:MAG: hypothetical protein D6770_09910 [Anaerolineae bacterium]|nr:MAG: hypothetical protein D6770_09910 [Anaerolineae bacterium]
MPFLNLPLILETRRNHALEHATLHILAEKYPGHRFAGHSNPTGFFILGDAPTEDVRRAVSQALTRLRAGERELAVHPGCGTNFLTVVFLSTTLAWSPLSGARNLRSRLWRLPLAILMGVIGFLLGQALGPALQARVTTEADLGNLRVLDIQPIRRGRFVAHRVVTGT